MITVLVSFSELLMILFILRMLEESALIAVCCMWPDQLALFPLAFS